MTSQVTSRTRLTMEMTDLEQVEEEDDDWGVGPLPRRRRSRALALQVLFEVDASGHSPETSLAWGLDEPAFSQEMEEFARELVRGVLLHTESLDAQIQRFAPAWPVGQLSLVDRNLLRMAIYEISIDQRTPPKVAINETVELAKLFGGDSSPRFVNGVLGTFMESLADSPKK